MVIKDSPIHGKGLFADKYYATDSLVLTFGEPKYLGYVNHSCVPTCYVKYDKGGNYGLNEIFTKKELKKGDEITVDYRIGQTFPQWSNFIKNRCNCEVCSK